MATKEYTFYPGNQIIALKMVKAYKKCLANRLVDVFFLSVIFMSGDIVKHYIKDKLLHIWD